MTRQIKGLRIDWDAGAGEVTLPAEFLDENALFRADVLKDWIYELTKLYDEAASKIGS